MELEEAAEHGARHGVKIKKPWDSADGYADPHVGAFIIVCPEPLCGVVLGLLDCLNDVLIQPFGNPPLFSGVLA